MRFWVCASLAQFCHHSTRKLAGNRLHTCHVPKSPGPVNLQQTSYSSFREMDWPICLTGLNFTAVLPTAWLSMLSWLLLRRSSRLFCQPRGRCSAAVCEQQRFGKWLPFDQLFETAPFLASAGLPGFLTLTVVILISQHGSEARGKTDKEDTNLMVFQCDASTRV